MYIIVIIGASNTSITANRSRLNHPDPTIGERRCLTSAGNNPAMAPIE
jgi:hypothetical protein